MCVIALQSRVRGPEDAFFSRIEPKEYGRDIPRKKRGDGRIVDSLNDTSTGKARASRATRASVFRVVRALITVRHEG